ncbi:hypothetical protein [Haloferula sp.]|uniref:hypothetical protein n=1 Tax=Haloferula sp. TaxID=2497595 RepID=UPI003C76E047
MKTPRYPAIWLLLCSLACPSPAATNPTFSGLGDLPGGNFRSSVTGISGDGTTVSGSSSSELSAARSQDAEAFRWRAEEGIVGLGFLQSTVRPLFSPPVSVSNGLTGDGNRIVGSGFFKTTGLDPFPDRRAVYWNDQNAIFALPLLSSASGSFTTSDAFAISNNGTTIVGESSSSGGVRAVRWNINSSGTASVLSLGVLQTPPQESGNQLSRSSSALAISSDGLTIVGSSGYIVSNVETIYPPPYTYHDIDEFGNLKYDRFGNPVYVTIFPEPYESITPVEQGTEAFVWRSSGGIQRLGDLPGGGWSSEASAVSSDGSVIVGYGSTSSTEIEGLRWVNQVMTSVGDLPGGSKNCRLHDVTGSGSIAVGSGHDEGGQTAVIWDEINGLRKLSDLLVNSGFDITGWNLTSAVGISADGDVIVGNGINPLGKPEAWRVSGASILFLPPEPELPKVTLSMGKVITFPTQPGNNYQAEYSVNLIDWIPFGDVHSTVGAATSSTHAVVDSEFPELEKFYQVTLLPGSASTFAPGITESEGAVISFQSIPGLSYQAKYSTDLTNWTNFGAPISSLGNANGIIQTVFETMQVLPKPAQPCRFYKLDVTGL